MPIARVISASTVITIRFVRGEKKYTPVRAPLIPSTPYVNGLNFVISESVFGILSKGKTAPDKKKIGIIRKFIIIGKACMSSNCEAIATPSAVNKIAIRNMNKNANGILTINGLNPTIRAIRNTIIPWNMEIVAPPNVFQIII